MDVQWSCGFKRGQAAHLNNSISLSTMDCERRRRRRHAAGAAGPPPPPRVLGAAEELVLLNQGVLVKWAEEGKGIQPRRVEHGSRAVRPLCSSVLLFSPLFFSPRRLLCLLR